MTQPRLAHLAVLALVASAGCIGTGPTDTITSTPPPLPSEPAVYRFNRSESFQIDYFAEQGLLAGPLFTAGSLVNPVTGQPPSAASITLAVADLASKQYAEGPTGTRVGTVSDFYAAHGPSASYVAFDARPPGGTNVMLEGWITWATYRDGGWQMEEAPPRWALRDLHGVAFFDGAPRVLLRGPQAYELWTLDGSWASEPLTGLDPTRAAAAMAANGTALIIAGTGVAGQPAVWERIIGQTAFTSYPLQASPGLSGAGFYAVSALPMAPAAVAWTAQALVPAPGAEVLTTALFTRGPDGWKRSAATIPGTAGPPLVVVGANATFLATIMTAGPYQMHRLEGGGWHECDFHEANRPRLLALGGTPVWADLYIDGARVVRLSTTSSSCLPPELAAP